MSESTSSTPAGKPPRAEPLQPDLPGSGNDTTSEPPVDDSARAAERQKQQGEDALANVREGYD